MATKRTINRGSPATEIRPIAGPEAFRDHEDLSHVHSQAATLLLIGWHLRGDLPAMQARIEASVQPGITPQLISGGDMNTLGFPPIAPTGERFSASTLAQLALGPATTAPSRKQRKVVSPEQITAAAEQFYRQSNSETAAALLRASLGHPRPLVRVAAASSYVDVAVDPQPAIRVLEEGLPNKDPLVRDVAAYALANVDPKHPRLEQLLKVRKRSTRRKRSRTSTIIHGTWAAASPWWQPGGDFWRYLHDNVDASLYGAADRFAWSGGYSDVARAQAGATLHDWARSHNLGGLDLYTHSHGGGDSRARGQRRDAGEPRRNSDRKTRTLELPGALAQVHAGFHGYAEGSLDTGTHGPGDPGRSRWPEFFRPPHSGTRSSTLVQSLRYPRPRNLAEVQHSWNAVKTGRP